MGSPILSSGTRQTDEETIGARLFIVVSGLPASGKSTLARALACEFGLPLLDKDDILEALFDALGAEDLARRQELSRASDQVLMRLAAESQGAVLASFWRHADAGGSSGTPWEWACQLSPRVVEVHFVCPTEMAVQRFRDRVRHQGHQDQSRNGAGLSEQFRGLAERGPLGAGGLVVVDTAAPYELAMIARAIEAAAEGTSDS